MFTSSTIAVLTFSLTSPSSLPKLPIAVQEQWNGGHVGVPNESCRGSLNAFFCLHEFTKMLAAWVKTLYKLINIGLLSYLKLTKIFSPSDDTILEQLASDNNTGDIALVRKFISASKDRAVKPESVTVDSAVKGLLESSFSRIV